MYQDETKCVVQKLYRTLSSYHRANQKDTMPLLVEYTNILSITFQMIRDPHANDHPIRDNILLTP